MSNIKDILAEARLPERAVSICLRGDLSAEFQRLEDRLSEANNERLKDKRLAKSTKPVEIAQEMEAVREKMRAATIEFTLRAFASDVWRSMKRKHPLPEKPEAIDRVLGADAKGLLNEAIQKAIVEPELDDEDWDRLRDTIADGEWQKLVDATYVLNEEGTNLPFSQAGSLALRVSGADSK